MRRPSTALVMAVAALAVSAAGIAHASIPAPDGTIRGCYASDPAGGAGVLKDLSVVDAADICPNGTNELLWNQTGPAGASGVQGPPGPSGKPEQPHGAYRTDIRFAEESVEVYGRQKFLALTVNCKREETAIGGGADIENIRITNGYFALVSSYPVNEQRSWFVKYDGVNPILKVKPGFKPYLVMRAWAVCARTLVTPVPPMPPATGVQFGPRP